jgi:O-antigen/teichoic acid export membrane protein
MSSATPSHAERRPGVRVAAVLRATRAGGVYVLGEAGGRALAYVALIACAALLPVEDFGALSLYLTLVALLALPSGLGLPVALVRFHVREARFDAVLGTALAFGLCGALTLGALVLVARDLLAEFVGIPVALVALAALGAPAQALRIAWLASLRARHRSGAHAASQLCEPLLLLAGLGAIALLARSIGAFGVALAVTLSTLAVGVAALASWSRDPGLATDRRLGAPLLRFSLPLVAHGFGMAALGGFDQIVVRQILGPEATGVYAFAYRLGMVMQALCVALSALWTPRALELLAAGAARERLDALAQRGANALLGAGLALMAALPIAARLVGGERYADAAALVPLVVYAYLWFLLYLIAMVYLLHAERTARIALGTAVAALVSIALDYLLVPRLGLPGAAVASIAGYALLFATTWCQMRHHASRARFGLLFAKVAACAPFAAVAYWSAR